MRVESGRHTRYYHDVEIAGSCRLVYRPNKPLSCGAKVWIEVESDVMVMPVVYSEMVDAFR